VKDLAGAEQLYGKLFGVPPYMDEAEDGTVTRLFQAPTGG
jgi:hypothetical protein